MAISTYKTFLMIGDGGSWSKLIDIKEFPDLGGVPEMLDTTTMSDGARTYILGIQETEANLGGRYANPSCERKLCRVYRVWYWQRK